MDEPSRLPSLTLKNDPDWQGHSASLPVDSQQSEFQFEREDWVLFRSVGTLSQKAGVPRQKLRRLVLKELVDNALDAGGAVVAFAMDDRGRHIVGDCGNCNRFVVHDTGHGLRGSPDEIARLFSIRRPLVSSKL
ncbi:ATP-binding protein [Microvirga rosea]|uniref:ATP-binding protein n=1 Tax=Microvirga rosea TaxID=2715425 RepID=UPI001D0A2E00|nr:ATP-binding protein [Microvirga rosea]MCB8820915.1 ATP-binding protein [Microvirga rosea]